jgi:SAM-dependent methyltransferase
MDLPKIAKSWIRTVPVVGPRLATWYWRRQSTPPPPATFDESSTYWENRYRAGGSSGAGSYGQLAEFKAEILNALVSSHAVRSVIEFGCGDGNQLSLASYPRYLGLDVSETAVFQCQARFAHDASKQFRHVSQYAGDTADLALSLDVIFHLVEDDVFESYMQRLFQSAERYVVIYASDHDEDDGRYGPHVRQRQFTRWVAERQPDWNLVRHVPNRYPFTGDLERTSFAEFFMYSRRGQGSRESRS